MIVHDQVYDNIMYTQNLYCGAQRRVGRLHHEAERAAVDRRPRLSQWPRAALALTAPGQTSPAATTTKGRRGAADRLIRPSPHRSRAAHDLVRRDRDLPAAAAASRRPGAGAGESEHDGDASGDLLEQYGLDQPLIVQYGLYMWQLLQGNLGISFTQSIPVIDVLLQRLPWTLLLTVTALVLHRPHRHPARRLGRLPRPRRPRQGRADRRRDRPVPVRPERRDPPAVRLRSARWMVPDRRRLRRPTRTARPGT